VLFGDHYFPMQSSKKLPLLLDTTGYSLLDRLLGTSWYESSSIRCGCPKRVAANRNTHAIPESVLMCRAGKCGMQVVIRSQDACMTGFGSDPLVE
jgi:hypothetical protein